MTAYVISYSALKIKVTWYIGDITELMNGLTHIKDKAHRFETLEKAKVMLNIVKSIRNYDWKIEEIDDGKQTRNIYKKTI